MTTTTSNYNFFFLLTQLFWSCHLQQVAQTSVILKKNILSSGSAYCRCCQLFGYIFSSWQWFQRFSTTIFSFPLLSHEDRQCRVSLSKRSSGRIQLALVCRNFVLCFSFSAYFINVFCQKFSPHTVSF